MASRPTGSMARPESPQLPSTVKRSHSTSFIASPNSNSPKTSREPSPARAAGPAKRSRLPSARARTRSRHNSEDDSPHRDPASPGLSSSKPSVSAAAVQQALATTGTPSLRPTKVEEEFVGAAPLGRSGKSLSVDRSLRWPTSPRLKSPPLNTASAKPTVLGGQRPDQGSSAATGTIQRSSSLSAPASGSHPGSRMGSIDADLEDAPPPPGMRTPVRGSVGAGLTLETVQENSVPSTPAPTSVLQSSLLSIPDGDETASKANIRNAAPDARESTETVSDSGGSKSDTSSQPKPAIANSSAHVTKPTVVAPAAAHSAMNSKGKVNAEGSVQSMTVETETVSSVPQVAVGGGAGDRVSSGRTDAGSNLRLKPSVETIRPKRERKRTMRKMPSLTSGTGSSKADVFEAKVAIAVDEANSSDSEETFVYESNPPEPHGHRPGRHHSRTPSTTSIHSQMDQRAANFAHHSLAGKRSMKFVGNPYHGAAADHGPGIGIDTSGSGRGSGRGMAHNGPHHHIAHWGRNGRTSHPNVSDTEALFAQGHSQSQTQTANTSRHSSRATSPRHGHVIKLAGERGKKLTHVASYDIDIEGNFDESTPLINSIRLGRGRLSGRGDIRGADNQRGWRGRFWSSAGFFALFLVIALVVISALACLFATTKPLIDIHVQEIRNVLASEPEIMLDLLVRAVNPNIITVTVGDMDVNLFAKSEHLKKENDWMTDSESFSSPTIRVSSYGAAEGLTGAAGVISDPKSDSTTMLLGRIFEFDSAPTFDGSPISYEPSSSIGEVRLSKPGNQTETGGSARWERVIQHPFELIVRGVLKYQLPLSSHVFTAPIGASAIVHPENGVDASGRMRLEPLPDARYPPGSNVPSHRTGLHPPLLEPDGD